MRANVARRGITYAGRDVIELNVAVACDQFDLRAYAVAVALHSEEPYGQPMVLACRFVAKQFCRLIQRGRDDVDAAVVVEIREGAAAMSAFDLEVGAGFARGFQEHAGARAREDAVRLAVGLIVVKLYVVV